jgi:hypothetical protein
LYKYRCKIGQLLKKQLDISQQKSNIELPYAPKSLVLSIFLRNEKILEKRKKMRKYMFVQKKTRIKTSLHNKQKAEMT